MKNLLMNKTKMGMTAAVRPRFVATPTTLSTGRLPTTPYTTTMGKQRIPKMTNQLQHRAFVPLSRSASPVPMSPNNNVRRPLSALSTHSTPSQVATLSPSTSPGGLRKMSPGIRVFTTLRGSGGGHHRVPQTRNWVDLNKIMERFRQHSKRVQQAALSTSIQSQSQQASANNTTAVLEADFERYRRQLHRTTNHRPQIADKTIHGSHAEMLERLQQQHVSANQGYAYQWRQQAPTASSSSPSQSSLRQQFDIHTIWTNTNRPKSVPSTKIKRFACPHCMKRFMQKSNMIAHTRIHTGERPFKCNICPRAFAQKSNLKRHLQIHSRKRKEAERSKQPGIEPSRKKAALQAEAQ
mmetsp:Transcript_35228/g.65269  ORF Transcript_35228/g.65269 Transcript_35228/m.65269 type:complete len:352 (-) Transcript_35228:999-2054(-)